MLLNYLHKTSQDSQKLLLPLPLLVINNLINDVVFNLPIC